MKILIFYTPRSKSTLLAKVLSKNFGLSLINDELTVARIQDQNFNRYPELLKKINQVSDTCVKICANDFVDLQKQNLSTFYKQIDFESFDHIIFQTRQNFIDALFSYAYMNPADRSSWHRAVGSDITYRNYIVTDTKALYLSRGYYAFNFLKQYIIASAPKAKFYSYDFDSVDLSLSDDWGISPNSISIDTVPNDIPYKDLVENVSTITNRATKIFNDVEKLTIEQFNDRNSLAWNINNA